MKIKTNLFEKIICCTIVPMALEMFFIPIYIISLINKSKDNYIFLLIIIAAVFLFVINIIICFLFNINTKEIIIIHNQEIWIYNKNKCEKVSINDIKESKYFKCKWYFIPFAYLYKKQNGGIITLKLNNGKQYMFRIFYKDYIQIKKYIENIIVL